MTQYDKQWMDYALRLAGRAVGRTAENPAVGCVLVREGKLAGIGWTEDGGRPHAETQALAAAGDLARGATAYVTLEPCAHHGLTPPCSQALIAAGVRRVVIACTDDDPRVAGTGVADLQAAGVEVTTGCCAAEARALNAGFFRRLHEGYPWITVKIATSADEAIAPASSGGERWITGEQSRQYGHLLRMRHDAIITGIGTVLADDPQLTCRLSGLAHTSPLRVVLDEQLRLPLESALVRHAGEVPMRVLTSEKAAMSSQANRLRAAGVDVVARLPESASLPRFAAQMQMLAASGINRVLIEGGQQLTAAALDSGLANVLYWFRAPHRLGEGAMPALPAGQSLAGRFANTLPARHIRLGDDVCVVYDGLEQPSS